MCAPSCMHFRIYFYSYTRIGVQMRFVPFSFFYFALAICEASAPSKRHYAWCSFFSRSLSLFRNWIARRWNVKSVGNQQVHNQQRFFLPATNYQLNPIKLMLLLDSFCMLLSFVFMLLLVFNLNVRKWVFVSLFFFSSLAGTWSCCATCWFSQQ